MRSKSKLEDATSNPKDAVQAKRWLCKICKTFLKTRTLLRQHRIKQHGIKREQPKELQKKIEPTKKKNLDATKKLQLQKLVSARVSRRLQLKKENTEVMKEKTPNKKVMAEEEKPNVTTEFECPVCKKGFPVFFSASKHIQKKHIDAQGEKK